MQSSLSVLSLLVASAAALTTRSLTLEGCTHLTNITMDAGSLPPPSAGLSIWHIAIGRGTQNYSCPTTDPSAPPISLGATATLFNVTCPIGKSATKISNALGFVIRTPLVDIEALADRLSKKDHHDWTSGHHYFTNDNKTATFNLNTGADSDYGIDFAIKINSVAAPAGSLTGNDGSAAVPWVQLQTIDAAPYHLKPADDKSGVKEIYRINTAGGAAPATCGERRGNFQMQYAAEYWFWH